MQRSNNFDFLRLLFASFVIISHAYPLSGDKGQDALGQWTNGQIIFSWIGVKGFFVISGFLILQSLQRSQTLIEYAWKRLLRLLPGLLLVLLLTVFLMPFFYEGAGPYLLNGDVWKYIPNNLLLYKLQFSIDGVFTHNPYGSVINGSLWTIIYEVSMYIFLMPLFFIRKHKQLVMTVLGVVFGVFIFLSHTDIVPNLKVASFRSNSLIELGTYFLAGSCLASFGFEGLNASYRRNLLFISLALVIVSLSTATFVYTKHVFFPVMLLSFALSSYTLVNTIGHRIGDLSYGIYLFGFPVQQALVYVFQLNALSLMIWSLLITSALAFFSWHFVESKALRLKNIHKTKISKRILPSSVLPVCFWVKNKVLR